MKAFGLATAWFGTPHISSKMIIFRLNYTERGGRAGPGGAGAGGYTPLSGPTFTGISLQLKAVGVSGRGCVPLDGPSTCRSPLGQEVLKGFDLVLVRHPQSGSDSLVGPQCVTMETLRVRTLKDAARWLLSAAGKSRWFLPAEIKAKIKAKV